MKSDNRLLFALPGVNVRLALKHPSYPKAKSKTFSSSRSYIIFHHSCCTQEVVVYRNSERIILAFVFLVSFVSYFSKSVLLAVMEDVYFSFTNLFCTENF